MSLYFDTSALVPAYLPEAFSEQVVVRLGEAGRIYLSRLTVMEFFSALSKKVRMEELGLEEAQAVATAFERHLQGDVYTTLRISNEVFDLGIRYLKGFDTPLRTLDGLHLACCAHAGLTMITADAGLADGAKRLGVACETIGSVTSS